MEIKKGQKVILFDGECNLCNGFINFIIDRDTKNIFLFSPLQSDTGMEIMENLKEDSSKLDSIVLFDRNTNQIQKKSSAAISIVSTFGGFWKLARIFFIFPSFIRNIIYDFVAKNRYRWFGKTSCRIPTPELIEKFLN